MALNSVGAQATGNALGDFIDTYLKAKQMKQSNDYQNQMLGLTASKSGLIKNASGEYEPSPLSQAQRQEQMQEFAKAGPYHDTMWGAANAASKKINPNGPDLSKDLTNKELEKYAAMVKPQYSGVITEGNSDIKNDFYKGILDDKAQSQHAKNLNRIDNNQNIKAKINQYQNLQGGLNNYLAADKKTPQAIDELQQTIRANLGIKGTSGVGEREKDYFNSLGLNSDRMTQFLTGDPVSIAADNGIVQHITQLANLESKNISSQMSKALETAGSGNASFYKKHPELYEDLKDHIKNVSKQVGGDQQVQAGLIPTQQPTQSAAPSGLMNSVKGFLGLGQAAPAMAAPAAAQQAPQAAPSSPADANTKVINGHTYQKVNGGWQLAQ